MRFTDNSVGQGTIVLMMAVIASALISGLIAIVMVQNLPAYFGNFVDDAGIIAEAEMRKDNIEKNYVPLSSQYAVSQASWEIGISNRNKPLLIGVDDDEGSEDADYNHKDERSDEVLDGSDSGSIGQTHKERMENVEARSQNEFDNYIQDYQMGDCQVKMVDNAEIHLGWKEDWINVTPQSSGVDELVNVSCISGGRKVFSQGEKEAFITEMTNNRFPDLFLCNASVDLFQGFVLGVVPSAGDVAFPSPVFELIEGQVCDVGLSCTSGAVDEQVLRISAVGESVREYLLFCLPVDDVSGYVVVFQWCWVLER